MSLNTVISGLEITYGDLLEFSSSLTGYVTEDDCDFLRSIHERIETAKEYAEPDDILDNPKEDHLNQIGADLETINQQFNTLHRTKEQDVFYKKIDTLQDECNKNDNIPTGDKDEITRYFQLIKEEKDTYGADQLISAFNSISDKQKLPYLIITQSILLQKENKLDSVDYQYHELLEKEMPELMAGIPKPLQDQYMDILTTATKPPFSESSVFLYALGKQISKQFNPNEQDIFSHPHIEDEFREYYLNIAKEAVIKQPNFVTDLLGFLPDIIKINGIKETKKIVDRGLNIKDENFKNIVDEKHRINLPIFYYGIHAGHRFAGSTPEEQQDQLNIIEANL
ncbi:MAG: hypothetical protein KAH93_02205 [Candidatus Aenigmarchaeota archaeon]|nr:hypothetical protein [Candidatus Aenigmarchaeota archaeon]